MGSALVALSEVERPVHHGWHNWLGWGPRVREKEKLS